MNHTIIVIAACSTIFLSSIYAMEHEPNDEDLVILDKLENMLLKNVKTKEDDLPAHEHAIYVLPFFLEKCVSSPYCAQWGSRESIDHLIRGISLLKNCYQQINTKKIIQSNQSEKIQKDTITLAHTEFEKAAQPFTKQCLIRNTSEYRKQQFYLYPALYAYAYTAIALEDYDLAHKTLIPAIEGDKLYVVGGMCIELLVALGNKLDHKPSQEYSDQHNLTRKVRQYRSIRKKLIDNAKDKGFAVINVLDRITYPPKESAPQLVEPMPIAPEFASEPKRPQDLLLLKTPLTKTMLLDQIKNNLIKEGFNPQIKTESNGAVLVELLPEKSRQQKRLAARKAVKKGRK